MSEAGTETASRSRDGEAHRESHSAGAPHPPSQAACDRLTAMAARVIGAPAAVLSVLDRDRPFLMAACGLPDGGRSWATTPLTVSLGHHAGSSQEPFVLEDVRNHALLADDPAVEALGLVSFLGVPLVDGRDSVVGILGVIDHEPRSWTDDEIRNLADIAEAVVTEIELRGTVQEVRRTERETASRTEARTRRSFLDLIHGLDAIITERDPVTGDFTFVSRKAEDLLGYPVERWLEESDFWGDVLVHPRDRERAADLIRQAVERKEDVDLEYRVRTADDRTLWLRDQVRVATDDEGRPTLLRGIMVDVTTRKEAAEELIRSGQAVRLLQEVAEVANEARSLDEPLQHALDRLAASTGWPVGHVYLPSADEPPAMVPTAIWHLADPEGCASFRRVTEETRFPAGSGLPGRVLASGRPAWVEDIEDDPNFPRAEAAAECGLRAAVAVPLLAEDEVVGVLEFFNDEPTPRDDELLSLTAHVGTILGRVAERMRAEAERRANESRLRMTVETAQEAFVSMDEEGRIREWNRRARETFGWERDEVLGRPLAETIIPERFRQQHDEGIRRFLETGEGPVLNRRIELPGLTRDGAEIPLEITISPMRTGRGWVFNAFMHDISERKKDERMQERREAQLAEAQRLARLGSWEWDMEQDVVTWSEQLYRIFGIEPGTTELDYNSYLELLPEDDRRTARDAVREALEKREGFSFEHTVVRPDGQERIILGQGRILVDDEGAPVRMVGTAQDITERKRLEDRARDLAAEKAAREEAEAAQAQVREVLESITDAFFAVDREWRLTVLNSEAERLLGRDRGDLVGETLWDVLPDGGGSTFEGAYRRAMDRRETVEFEEYYAPLASWFEVRAYPAENGLSIYLHDINERKRTERALRESEERYRFLADSIPQQIWTARPDGRYDYVNRVVVAYSGRDADELVGDGWMKLVHDDDVDTVTERWTGALETGDPYEVECRLIRHDGEARWHLVRAHPQHGEGGEILKWFGTSTDIHDQKEVEAERDRAAEELEKINYILESERGHLERQARELRETTRALERSNQDLDRFAYVASHDLKAPLRGIANLTEWLEEDISGELDTETRRYMDLLKGRVHRMEALIDGILQYSRAGRGGNEKEWVGTEELAREVVDMIDPPERFSVEIDSTMPSVLAPRAPLQQVFLNLVSNAVKHADGEEPRVRIRCTDEGTEWYEFSVEDNGPGIPEEFREKIWTIFQTLKPRDEVEGTGIGLSVVKRTVEHHGGQVWVESDDGGGAAFRFLWPKEIDQREEGA